MTTCTWHLSRSSGVALFGRAWHCRARGLPRSVVHHARCMVPWRMCQPPSPEEGRKRNLFCGPNSCFPADLPLQMHDSHYQAQVHSVTEFLCSLFVFILHFTSHMPQPGICQNARGASRPGLSLCLDLPQISRLRQVRSNLQYHTGMHHAWHSLSHAGLHFEASLPLLIAKKHAGSFVGVLLIHIHGGTKQSRAILEHRLRPSRWGTTSG